MYELCYEVSWMNYYRLWERYQHIQMITCTTLTSKLLAESFITDPTHMKTKTTIGSPVLQYLCRNSKIHLKPSRKSLTGNVSHVSSPH